MTEYYEDWNSLLLKEYFSPAMVGEEIWVRTTRAELDSFGFHLGGAAGLINAVIEKPYKWRVLNKDSTLSEIAQELVAKRVAIWGRRKIGALCPPPYLPHVAIWVLAATEMGTDGFYQTVENLLGVPFNGPDAMEALDTLWSDLELWSAEQNSGRYGIFRVRELGSHRYVGLAKDQALITGTDHIGIARLFRQEGLYPGQDLSENDFRSLAVVATQSNYIGTSLKAALGDLDTYCSVLHSAFKLRLLEWNGKVPRLEKNLDAEGIRRPNDIGQTDDLTLVLRDAFHTDWELGWRSASSVDGHSIFLEIEGVSFTGQINELTGYVTYFESDAGKQEAVQAACTSSVEDGVRGAIVYTDDSDENGLVQRACVLADKRIRILANDANESAYNIEYVERDLPLRGHCFLLVSDLAVTSELKSAEIPYENVNEISGLPPTWVLLQISDVSILSVQKKNILQSMASNAPDSAVQARLKLAHGSSILRGGVRQYLEYDLPIVELEAPEQTTLRAESVKFEEIVSNVEVTESGIRRYKILREKNIHSFEISAFLNGERISKLQLRIDQSLGFENIEYADFSISEIGECIDNSNGLRGALIDGRTDELEIGDLQYFEFDSGPFQSISKAGQGVQIFNSVTCHLLDLVAKKGSYSFRMAKQFVEHQSAELGVKTLSPTLMMLNLRSRGFVELETDAKGRVIRLHSAKPVIFSTQSRDVNAGEWFGICGTLTLEHWKSLYEGYRDYLYVKSYGALDILSARLLFPSQKDLKYLIKECDFEFIEHPSIRISEWASDLNDARNRLSQSRGFESFPVNNLQRLNPQRAMFSTDNSTFMTVDKNRKCELFKVDDPVVIGQQVYMLGTLSEGVAEYNYIHDSRLGVWLAVSAFAKMIADTHGIGDAYPWPIPYNESDGSFWLPARLKPPLVFERALCLASGCQPEQVVIEDVGPPHPDGIELMNVTYNGLSIAKVSAQYTDMCVGTWLCYRFVPPKIAQNIAANMNCKLVDIY